jgi:exosome complex component RRP41
MGGNSKEPLAVDGVRTDGRKPDEFRPIKMEVGVLDKADGSARVEFGKTKVLAAVYGPREMHPRHDTLPNKAVVRCKYDMMSFSVEERARPGRSRRSMEISKVLSEALESVVYTDRFPGMAIDIFVEVYQADASTRVTGLNAASLALANAGIPMKDLVTSCSFGKIQATEKGKATEMMVLDVGKEEDNVGLADVAMAIQPGSKKVVLLQMDGDLSTSEFNQGVGMGIKMCEKLYEEQKKALKRGFEVNDDQ